MNKELELKLKEWTENKPEYYARFVTFINLYHELNLPLYFRYVSEHREFPYCSKFKFVLIEGDIYLARLSSRKLKLAEVHYLPWTELDSELNLTIDIIHSNYKHRTIQFNLNFPGYAGHNRFVFRRINRVAAFLDDPDAFKAFSAHIKDKIEYIKRT